MYPTQTISNKITVTNNKLSDNNKSWNVQVNRIINFKLIAFHSHDIKIDFHIN